MATKSKAKSEGLTTVKLPETLANSTSTASEFPYVNVSHYDQIISDTPVDSIGEGIAETSEGDFHQSIARIQGQISTVKVEQERWKLQKEIYKREGLRVEAETEKVNTLIKVQNWNTAQVKLSQAKTQTAIEQTKLSTMERDLRGYRDESSLKSTAWDLKIEGLQTDIDLARQLLHQKKQALLDSAPNR